MIRTIQGTLIMALLLFSTDRIASHSAAPPPPGFRIRALSGSERINVADKSLADWDQRLVVIDIPAAQAGQWQLALINGSRPSPLTPNDAGLKALMATDASYWYIAAEVTDDVVLGVPASSPYPYSGDCLEIFYAAKSLDSGADIHEHVSHPRAPSSQAAFLQVDLPAATLSDASAYLPDWRTDPTIRRMAVRAGFSTTTWRTPTGWTVEARIPRAIFEPEVQKAIERHSPLKLHVSLLDYDKRIAQRTQADFHGFNPDNVIALETEQHRLSTPRFMRTLVFD
jgi:hypothetical protein